MVKGEVNDRQKATKPTATKEQIRLAQVTQEFPSSNDTIIISHVRKVMELTRCTQHDAEFALLDHKNDIDGAVLAVLERAENGDSWKESKGRKSKKQDINDRDDYYGNRRSDAPRGIGAANRGRGGNYPNRGANSRVVRSSQGQEPRKDRPQQPSAGRGSSNSARGGRPGNFTNNKEKSQEDDQKFPAVDSFSADLANKDDENTWKNGPLVFEQTVQAAPVYAPVVTAAPTPPKSDKPTFAAVAASKKIQPPPVVQPPATPSVSSVSQVSSSPAVENNHRYKADIKESVSPTRQFSSSMDDRKESSASPLVSTSLASTSFGPVVASNMSVNKEFTDQLKNDIGLHSSSVAPSINSNMMATPSVPNTNVNAQQPEITSHNIYSTDNNTMTNARSSSILHDVEFVSGDGGPSILDFQFGFHPDVPSSHDMLSDRQQMKGREAALSFVNSGHVNIQPEDLRLSANNLAGQKMNTMQQQQVNHASANQPLAQQQQQHNSLQQQQQQMYAAAAAAQFPGYAIPYLYSPVASNMNSMRDVDQLNSYTPLNPFPYGLNQLDMQMSAMLPPSMQSGATAQAGGALNVATQNHQQQQSATSQQHRAPAVENKFQQGNVNPTNGMQSNASYQGLGSQSQAGHQLRNQGLDNGAGTGANNVAPPPGFSGPPFLTQPSFQSLFQMPSYTHPAQMSIPYFLQGNNQQRQPQSQHPSQNANLQQQHHQRPAEHASYLEMNMKYPQQANLGTTANNSLPQSGNSNYQTGQRGNQLAGSGQAMDNGLQQYYQSPKWSGGNGGWRG